MFESNNKIRIFIFILLSMILTVPALEINILNVLKDFKCKTKIEVKKLENGIELYAGTSLKSYYYEASYENATVIAYIVDETRFEEIANPNVLDIRREIGEELGWHNNELAVFGVKQIYPNEVNLITEFFYNTIKPHPNSIHFKIVTMEEETFDHDYFILSEEETLRRRIRSTIPKMKYRSKRPDPSNIKQVKLYDLSVIKNYKVTTWPVSVKNGEYDPAATMRFSNQRSNLMVRHPNPTFHILIVGGNEYNRIMTEGGSLGLLGQYAKITNEMAKNEYFVLMGCFNFDWSEIDVVRQIILRHTDLEDKTNYNVFTIGIGMFETAFRNDDDRRCLPPTQDKRIIEFAKNCSRGASSKRTLLIYDFNVMPNPLVKNMTISLLNGRYDRQSKFKDYRFSTQYPEKKFAFIVMDSTEVPIENFYAVVRQHAVFKMFKNNDTVVFLIRTINLKLYDLHIIPEWVDYHRGNVHPNQISIVGCGTLDTSYQFMTPSSQVSYTPSIIPNKLEEFRQAFVKTAGNKSVFVLNIDTANSKFASGRYPMHTINGFYDPIVLSEDQIFETRNVMNNLFLITGADNFDTATETDDQISHIKALRQEVRDWYPVDKWTVYLIGLDRFGNNDMHLFAEFVKIHTIDERPLSDFVHIVGDGIYHTAYVYKDTDPFIVEYDRTMLDKFNNFFRSNHLMSELKHTISGQ